MRVAQSNTYLVEILIPMAYMPLDRYVQEATKGPEGRFFVTYGRGTQGRSISEKNVRVLASGIIYL